MSASIDSRLNFSRESSSSMPESRALSHSSNRGDSTQAEHGVQLRLAAAERHVALALRDHDYDQLIAVSTEALEEKPKVMDKKVIKSRKNLLWARSHAYRHTGSHELALRDAKKALKLDPHDPGSFLRTAAMLANAGHSSQAESCLDQACELAQRLDPPTKAEWLCKIQKQRRALDHGKTSPIDVLPNEVLVQVAQHLDLGDLSAMGQTCRRWRQTLLSIPALWRSITIPIKAKRLSESKYKSWLQHVEMCTARANNTLESVTFVPPFPLALLDKVLDLLRGSAATLVHLALPVNNQQICYSRLYRYCPRLSSVDSTGCDGNTPREDFGRLLPCSEEALLEPFSLQVFRSGCSSHHPSLVKHLHSLRVFECCPCGISDALASRADNVTITREDIFQLLSQLLKDNAATLQELSLPFGLPTTSHGWVSMSINFPKAVKAVLSSPLMLQFRFPSLLDLDLRLDTTLSDDVQHRLVALLATSPCLRTLKFSAPGTAVRHEILTALEHLADLQTLDLNDAGCATGLVAALLPTATRSESGKSRINWRFSRLRELKLDASMLDLTRLAAALIVRDSLLNGETLQEAHQASNELLKALSHNTSTRTASAFQRGARTSALPLSNQEYRSPRLDNAPEHSRLVKMCLTNLRELPEDVESALRLTVPELECSYSPL